MQIKKNIDGFIADYIGKEKIVLLFGPNRSVADSRCDRMKIKLVAQGYDFIKISFDQIKSDLTMLWQELTSQDLFNKKKLILLDVDTSTIKNNLLEIFDKISSENVLIIKAGDLPPANNLRKHFENKENLISIGCYQVEQPELRKFIFDVLKAKQIKTTVDLVSMLAAKYDNPMLLANDLEVLDLWLGERRELLPSDIDKVSGIEEFEYIDFAYALALNDKKRMLNIFYEMQFKGLQMISIIRALLNFYNRIYSYQVLQVEYGEQQALSKIYPSVYFKEKPSFLRASTSLKKEDLLGIISSLVSIEQIIKGGDSASKLCFENFLIHLNETRNISRHISDCLLAFSD
jgi:DNA polymerase III delta subunit